MSNCYDHELKMNMLDTYYFKNKNEAVKQSVTGNIFSYDGEIISISQEMANSRELINNVTFSEAVPSAYEISNAYPNPFNPSTSLR